MIKYTKIVSYEEKDVITNLKWILASNSVPVIPRPRAESWPTEDLLMTWKHYIPIEEDSSDLNEKIKYFELNLEKVNKIAINRKSFAQNFSNLRVEKEIQKSSITQAYIENLF